MVQHWFHHNEDHARSYRQWAERARGLGQAEVGRILEEVALESLRLNGEMERILTLLRGDSSRDDG
jgi:hypothetical protein